MASQVCIFGAGAIGGWMGVALGQAGCSVSAVARGATLAALQQDGLRLTRPDGSTAHTAVRASAQPADLGAQDLVVLAVKAPALPEVVTQIAPLIGPHTTVLTAMNGVPWWFLEGVDGPARGQRLASVDRDGRLAAALPATRILGGVVHASCSLIAPGHVRHHFGNKLILGEPDGTRSARLAHWAGLIRQGGIEVDETDRVQRDIWYKLWGNLTMNPISALTGATTDVVLSDPLVIDLVNAVMREAKTVGEQLGLPIDQQPADRHAATRRLGVFKTSMLQDVEAGKPLEIDALVGAAYELGQLTGVPMPHTGALFGLVRLMAQTRGLY